MQWEEICMNFPLSEITLTEKADHDLGQEIESVDTLIPVTIIIAACYVIYDCSLKCIHALGDQVLIKYILVW